MTTDLDKTDSTTGAEDNPAPAGQAAVAPPETGESRVAESEREEAGIEEAPAANGEETRDESERAANTEAKPAPPEVKVPEFVDFNEFQKQNLVTLHGIAQEIGLRVAGVRSKHQLVFEILCFYAKRGTRIEAEGILDYQGDSYGFLRWPALSFASNADDVYLSQSFIRKYDLKPGNLVRAWVRGPREREKFISVEEILSIEGIPAEEWQPPLPFDRLTPLFPKDRVILENREITSPSTRVVDLIAPLGKGQRGLIVAPPRGGKTILLKNIAASIHKNHPEVELIVLLLDERPEEVTDFRESVDTTVYASTFDESARRHVQVSDLVLERAKRLVEQKRDVVILLDSLTRLARGHNSAIQGGGGGKMGGGGGRMGSGGVDTKALQRSGKFFSVARNVEEGGSLTILATCLIETDSKMDDVIFEEFKGKGNMEIILDRELAEKRIYPAIHAPKSGTRKDDLLYDPEEFKRVGSLRRQLAQLPAGEAMETLVKNIRSTSSNAELLLRGLR